MSVCSTTAAASTKQVRRDNRNPNTRTRANSSHGGLGVDKRDGQGQRYVIMTANVYLSDTRYSLKRRTDKVFSIFQWGREGQYLK
ncbi:hypothetical protein CHS0354_026506 [Potamilus streckersoni]|uniref:Uncharacterized protein n=1 Tax=Potamilus streckersoni TaxID=2493646 RepID=A0AAE0RQ00_9BIVA|nr:hypothetical protein CHS0354_026506 [Potamilus streckersoni]